MKSGFKIGLLGLLSILSIPSPVFAGGIVASCDEASLRAALAGGGSVTFSSSGTITLANTLIITNNTSIDASGQTVSISGNNAVRLFYVNPGVSLTLIGLTVTNGSAAQGGGLYNSGGNVVVSNCNFLNNLAVGYSGPCGGAIYQAGGALTLLNSCFSGNQALCSLGSASCGGAVWFVGNVTVTNCSFSGNCAGTQDDGYAEAGFGGALFTTNGQLSGWGCWFTNNSAIGGMNRVYYDSYGCRGEADGGAIYCGSGPVTLSNGAVVNCVAQGSPASGGAIFHASGTLVMSNVLVLGNGAAGGLSFEGGSPGTGGGIYSGDTAVLIDCSVSSNSASGGGGYLYSLWILDDGGSASGGGIYCAGTLELNRCTVAGNGTIGGGAGQESLAGNVYGGNAYGGGVCCQGNLASFLNCTIAGNFAQGGAPYYYTFPGNSYGGGIEAAATQTSLTNCTLAANKVVNGGGSAGFGGNLAGAGPVQLVNTILAGGISNNAYGTLTDLGHNLSSDNSCAFTNIGSLNNTNPKLGSLANNGGLTMTLSLMPDSPAIDAGVAVPGVATDQRGVARPYGSAPDMGAYEWNASSYYPSFQLSVPVRTNGNCGFWIVGPTGTVLRLQSSPDLVKWSDVSTNSIGVSGTLPMTDPNASAPVRFYRTVSP